MDALPLDVLCLTRSLVLLRLLVRRGLPGRLVIGVKPGATLDFSAHAWIELDGVPLLEPGSEDLERLVSL